MLNELPVGTVRLDLLNQQEAAVRLVAILPQHQGKKLGSKMLSAIEDYAKQLGIIKLVTNAAVNAKKFYGAIGFVSEYWNDPGEGISQPTIPMVKYLEDVVLP